MWKCRAFPGTPAEAGAGAQGARAAPAALGPRGRPAPGPLHLRGPSLARTLTLPLQSAVTCDAAHRDASVDRRVAAAEPAGLARGSPTPPPPRCSRRAPSGSQRRRRLPTPGSLRARQLREPLPQLLIGRSARPNRALIGQPGRWDGPRTAWTYSPRPWRRSLASRLHPWAPLQTLNPGSCPSAPSGAGSPSTGRSGKRRCENHWGGGE